MTSSLVQLFLRCVEIHVGRILPVYSRLLDTDPQPAGDVRCRRRLPMLRYFERSQPYQHNMDVKIVRTDGGRSADDQDNSMSNDSEGSASDPSCSLES